MRQQMSDIIERLPITEADIQRYEADGAICLRGLFDTFWIERLRGATERSIATSDMSMAVKGDPGRFSGDIFMWQKDKDFRAFVFESPAALIAKTLMRSAEVRFFADQLFVKEPGTRTPSPWHHDQTYWPVLGEGVCSVWVTLDPVTIETSGLEYVAGSHRWGRRFNPEDFGEVSLEMFRSADNEKIPDIEANRDAYKFLSWDMQPGDCLVHHSLAVHGARGNKSTTIRRRAHSSRWFGDTARYRPQTGFTSDVTGLQAGDSFSGPMFPVVDTASMSIA